jgi:DNA (cytosine-5)-methyltransferase 1
MPTAISMFCGCGGMDLGFHQAGFEILWANDNNADCAKTYDHNFSKLSGKHSMVLGDIAELPIPKLTRKVDVLIGGFPCQAYSNAGQRNGLKDSRGRLYEYCLKYIETFKPKFTVFENVRGFLSIKGENRRLFEEIAESLIGLGYEVHLSLINAADYGVPQNRLRVVMVGKRCDIKHPYYFPQKVSGQDLTLSSILDIPSSVANQDDVIRLNPQAYVIGNMVPEGGSWKSIPYDKLPRRLQFIHDNMARYRWPNFYRRFARSEIAGTITAAFKPENAGVWHPVKDRAFSAREIARIQSFPDDFEFVASSVKAMYQMIGNAVPPALAMCIANSIIASLKGKAIPQPVVMYSHEEGLTKPIRPGDPEIVFRGGA